MVQRREWKAALDADLIATSGYSSHDFDHGRCPAAIACYRRRNLEELRLPRIVHDKEQMTTSLLRLQALRNRGVQLFYGHDSGSWQTVQQEPLRIA